MKKWWTLVLALCLALNMTACGAAASVAASSATSSAEATPYPTPSLGEPTEITFPVSQKEKTEANAPIFEVSPFVLSICLPEGWTVGQQPIEKPLLKFGGVWSVVGLYDVEGTYVGAIGYNIYEKYEGAENDPQAIYSEIALGNNWHFDVSTDRAEGTGYYTPVLETETGVTATTQVYYDKNTSEEMGYGSIVKWNRGILSYDSGLSVYIACELNDYGATSAEWTAMAQTVELRAA